MKGKFNIVAVASPSTGQWCQYSPRKSVETNGGSLPFRYFYSDRYLTTSRVKSIHNALAGIPYEHIIILANTDVYGGGGIYNSYTLTVLHHRCSSRCRAKFGHSFGGLVGRYFSMMM